MTGSSISYQIRQSAVAKHIRISISCLGIVTVTKPQKVPHAIIDEVIRKKTGWILKKLEYFKKKNAERIFLPGGYRENKESARNLIESRLNHFNLYYNLPVGRISVRNQRTRWGSCSKNGNLNFNYRIICLAPELADYLVVHELCHIQEMNHSKKFWELVSRCIPDYKKARRTLRSMLML